MNEKKKKNEVLPVGGECPGPERQGEGILTTVALGRSPRGVPRNVSVRDLAGVSQSSVPHLECLGHGNGLRTPTR